MTYNFEIFDHFIWLVSFYKSTDEKALNELINLWTEDYPNKDIFEDVIYPLENEIKLNLVNTIPTEGKISLIRHYLYEFRTLQYFFDDYDRINKNYDIHDTYTEMYFINKKKERIIPTSYDVYTIRCTETTKAFATTIFRECKKYQIKLETLSDGFNLIHEDFLNLRKGRNYQFDIKKTHQWYLELIQLKEFQKPNGDPIIGNIVGEIIDRHFKLTGDKPSASAIKVHRQKLGLTRQ